MDKNVMIIIAVVAVLAVIASLWIMLYVRGKKNRVKRRGIQGEKKVAGILNRYVLTRGYKVINDITLPLYDKTTQIDHVLIGYFGVLVIETKNYTGDVFGNPNEKNWLHVVGKDRNKFYNPILQNKMHMDNIRYVFNKEDIYNINIESLVVFADKKLNLNVPKGLPLLKINKLKKLLHSIKYSKDRGVDVDKIYNALMKHKVTDPKLLAQHNNNVAKMAKSNRV